MADHSTLIVALKANLPESSWPWVICALRQDALVWAALQEPALVEKAISSLAGKPEAWSPAVLASLSLDQPLQPDGILRHKALQAYEQLIRKGPAVTGGPDLNLANAGLLALALCEHRHLSSSWSDLTSDLSLVPVDSPSFFTTWSTPLAVIFGLAGDPIDLLKVLVSAGSPPALFNLVLHAVLSNPLPPARQEQILFSLLTDLDLPESASLIRPLNLHRPEMAVRLARQWLKLHPALPASPQVNYANIQIDQLAGQLFQADMHAYAGQLDQSASLRSSALGQVNKIQVEIASQLADAVVANGDIQASLKIWQEVFSKSNGAVPPNSLLFGLLENGQSEAVLELLPKDDINVAQPAQQLANAYLAAQKGDLSNARHAAHQVLYSLEEQLGIPANGQTGTPSGDISCYPQHGSLEPLLNRLVTLLLDLSSPAEALRAARLAHALSPNDIKTLTSLALASRLAGEPGIAVQAAHLAVILEPKNPELRRQLAESLESVGEWSSALAERRAVLDPRFASPRDPSWPLPPDWHALAYCALQVGDPQGAIAACQNALVQNPEDGLAQAAYGEALVALGDERQALEHFRLATQQAPHQAAPWLSLANAYQRAGQAVKAIETLSAASHAVPDDPKVHLALAEAHLTRNSPTQAQTSLQHAHELVAASRQWALPRGSRGGSPPASAASTWDRDLRCRIALLYGQTLTQLGHPDQACQVYASAYQAYPAYPGLAYAYAHTLLELGEHNAALAPLVVTLASEPKDPAPYLDYANALLAVQEQPEEAVRALQKVLVISDELIASSGSDTGFIKTRMTAQALLAEALEASGQLEEALKAYSHALESSLSTDATWRIRLSLGMARVALRLGQAEIAIAALQEINVPDGLHPQVSRILSEAYAAIHLPEEALQAARTAVELAPDDVVMLAWFADQALILGARKEATSALTRAVQLDPERINLLIRLGEVFSQSGDTEAAVEAYHQVLASPTAQSEHLYQVALQMLELGDISHAIQCLERAIQQQPNPPSVLLRDLAAAYQQEGDLQRALETLDRAIHLEPDDPAMHSLKADLLLLLDRPQAAQACLEHALNLHPRDANIHQRMASLLRSQGDLSNALNHAGQSVKSYMPDDFSLQALASRAFSADLARAILQPDEARAFLGALPPATGLSLRSGGSHPPTDAVRDAQLTNYFCIFAELALDQDEEITAADALTMGYEIASEHPRLQALQARLAHRRGDHTTTLASLQAAVVAIDLQVSDTLGLALAAMDLGEWDIALEFSHRASATTPCEPFSHLLVVRGLVSRAEYQRLCAALEVTNHAPGSIALAEEAHQAFSAAIQSTLDCLPEGISSEPPLLIRRWRARGQAVFQPDSASLADLKDLPADPVDQAAYIAALSLSGDLPAISEIYKNWCDKSCDTLVHHLLHAQYALAIGFKGRRQEDMDNAIGAAHAAIDQLPNQPLYHTLLARLAQGAEDEVTAQSAIQTALAIWPEEPRWHTLAAELYQSTGDLPSAITHLEKAIGLEPMHFPHHLALGEAYLQLGKPIQAVQAMEQAAQIQPQRFEPYLSLAQAYYASGDLANAAKNAERAISVAPGQASPLLLRAEIALQMGDPHTAHERAAVALRLNLEDPSALHVLGRALDQLGRHREALEVVEKAIPLAANPLPLLLERVQLLKSAQDTETALSALKELAGQYPDEPDVLARLAISHADAGQREEAILYAQRALRGGSKRLKTGAQAHLHHLLGGLLRQTGQLDQAIHQLSEATRLVPDQLEPYLDLGGTQQERRQHTLALQTYQKAIAIAPNDPRPYFQAALAHKACRDYQESESMLRRAAELAPDDLAIHRQLAALVALNLVHNRRPVPLDV